MKREYQITIKNPFYSIIFKLRMKRAVKKWNCDLQQIDKWVKEDKDENASFKWGQLVWQEITMWIRLSGPKTTKKELDWMCKRRGFNDIQRKYLESMMKHVWLYS